MSHGILFKFLNPAHQGRSWQITAVTDMEHWRALRTVISLIKLLAQADVYMGPWVFSQRPLIEGRLSLTLLPILHDP